MLRRALPVIALALGLSSAGCGDDSLTAQQLRTRASVICARTAAATDRIVVPSTPAQGARFLQQGLGHLRPAVAELRELKAPEVLRKRYERAVELAGQEVALIARHRRAIADGGDTIATYRRLDAALAPLTREENAYWRALKLAACVRR